MAKKLVKNLHAGHRDNVRRRFLGEGLSCFADHNILEMILFYAIPRRDTNELAHRLIDHFGSFAAVFDADVRDLCKVEGIGMNAAVLIKSYPAVSKRYYEDRFRTRAELPSYEILARDLVLHFAGLDHEEVYALFYDSNLRLTAKTTLYVGDINSVAFSIRDVCDQALKNASSYLILAHNHPHGVPIASSADLDTTRRMITILDKLSITLIDHFIIAEDRFTSLTSDNFYAVKNGITWSEERMEERSEKL